MTNESYSEWKRWAASEFGRCSKADSVYFAAELRRSGITVQPALKIVEIGFGNGAFASWAVGSGTAYRGVEASAVLVQRAREKGYDAYESCQPMSDVAAGNSVDLVAAFDVFEHLEQAELIKLLLEIRTVLRVGGRVVARVPSGDSPFARSVQHGDLTHHLTLGSSAVRQLAKTTGFDVIQLRPPVLPWGGAGCLGFARRGLVSAGRAVLYPLIARLLMGGGAPVLSPNMVVVLERSSDGLPVTASVGGAGS